ncbi:39S ribosomal protein L46, mitochondrial [Bombyx mandarina]|uniref:Large ribosomal subunit protein mL46 n=3 Tax=Bombyx TaxID=7090 RepID=A0A8R2G939_BOMMO|nr:39S ribosomal protein L46, mitochondrial isoform X1 [Bombyx mori]XP_028037763.1 39S ribosomal protein L46, mitochondrial [Bombyx mandarina]
MLVKTLMRMNITYYHRLLIRSISSKPAWDILTGICIERLPVVTPPLTEMQKKYKEFLLTVEFEKSMKSNHEIQHENDKKQAELFKAESQDVDIDAVNKVTAQDFEDAANEEYSKFKFGNLETDADKKGDKTSTERCLQRHLVLVTQRKLGNDSKTLLPQGHWQEGETLRQTAERIVKEQIGSELQIKFISNAPCGFYKYKYPSEMNGKVGAKIFFYYANYKSGNPTKSKVNWLTRKELDEMLPQKYSNAVKEFLIEETY